MWILMGSGENRNQNHKEGGMPIGFATKIWRDKRRVEYGRYLGFYLKRQRYLWCRFQCGRITPKKVVARYREQL